MGIDFIEMVECSQGGLAGIAIFRLTRGHWCMVDSLGLVDIDLLLLRWITIVLIDGVFYLQSSIPYESFSRYHSRVACRRFR